MKAVAVVIALCAVTSVSAQATTEEEVAWMVNTYPEQSSFGGRAGEYSWTPRLTFEDKGVTVKVVTVWRKGVKAARGYVMEVWQASRVTYVPIPNAEAPEQALAVTWRRLRDVMELQPVRLAVTCAFARLASQGMPTVKPSK